MAVVIFLPGGLMEGGQKIGALFRKKSKSDDQDADHQPKPAPHVAE